MMKEFLIGAGVLIGALGITFSCWSYLGNDAGKIAELRGAGDGPRVKVVIVALDMKTYPATYIVRYPDGREGHVVRDALIFP